MPEACEVTKPPSGVLADLGSGAVTLARIRLVLRRQRGDGLMQFSRDRQRAVWGCSPIPSNDQMRPTEGCRRRSTKVTMLHRCDCGGSPLLPKDATTERRGEA